jgi:hypothetical protein
MRIVQFLSAGVLVAALAAAGSVCAQTTPVNHFTSSEIKTGSCWIDAKTGEQVETGPAGWRRSEMIDENRWSFGGRNFVRNPDGSWIDAANGESVTTGPAGWRRSEMIDENHWSLGGRNFVRVPCPQPETSQTSGGPPSSPGGLHSSNTVGFTAGTFGLDYAHFSPKTGSDGDQWGLSGSGLFGLTPSFSLQLDGGYNRISGSGSGSDLNDYTLGGSLIYSTSDWRLGGNLGYEKDKQGSYSAAVTNYGAFGQHWWRTPPGPVWEVHAKAGGFHVDHNFGDGYYVGGGASFYPTPNWNIGVGIDHSHFDPFGGSDEDDYWLDFEDYFCPSHHLSFWGGYTRSEFSHGGFHVDTISIGLRFYLNGEGKPTLVDQHSTGVLPFSPAFTGIQYKF